MRLRVVACPPAGAGAQYFRPLARAGVQVWSVRYPGRESRMREPFAGSIRQLADEVVEALSRVPDDGAPTVLLGHSMGVGVAAHAAARAARTTHSPDLLVLSARAAPAERAGDPEFRRVIADDARLHDWLSRLGGTPPELLADQGFMALALPVLRADLTISLDDAELPQGPTGRLDVPLVLLCGRTDPVVSLDQLSGWRGLTRGPVTVHALEGGHDALIEDTSWLELAQKKRLPEESWSMR